MKSYLDTQPNCGKVNIFWKNGKDTGGSTFLPAFAGFLSLMGIKQSFQDNLNCLSEIAKYYRRNV